MTEKSQMQVFRSAARQPQTGTNTQLSILSTSRWVMLEQSMAQKNLWMSLYTYMDDEDAF